MISLVSLRSVPRPSSFFPSLLASLATFFTIPIGAVHCRPRLSVAARTHTSSQLRGALQPLPPGRWSPNSPEVSASFFFLWSVSSSLAPLRSTVEFVRVVWALALPERSQTSQYVPWFHGTKRSR
ncbi:uncharacterized protein BO95DRAFT_445793 [Aspergillus brunneoviolaceus CBS 621.78]|uniref:Uncharacterized protein n=1 Tax=Aspergillus brunneoviolaceus CBS 621.78 TaxID=1450534 RepID=A0ACD1G0F6_9EURO|nr:hypothetical protein BO95DRAFT_445793 [Aspergillus brunneoviolaceus CBS 621.78]RAH42692.1 hypothetical protein BO95DRAFT_445793 [Aspergillus brunneoviolaceus CBS 621.78]